MAFDSTREAGDGGCVVLFNLRRFLVPSLVLRFVRWFCVFLSFVGGGPSFKSWGSLVTLVSRSGSSTMAVFIVSDSFN